MKTLFLLLFMAVSISCFSQARIGYTEYDIRYKEFPEKTFTSSRTNDGTRFIAWSTENTIIAYYLNENNVCYSCRIACLTRGALNFYVEKFNREYVIVDDTSWKMYTNNGITKITLHLNGNTSTIDFDDITPR